MGALANPRKIVVLLLLLPIAVAVIAWVIITAASPSVRGQPGALPHRVVSAQTLPPVEFGEEADEIDPEACLITILKIIEGPILVSNAVIPPFLTPPAGVSVVREQTIAQVISACNVDDEVRPPNLERELDVDIEVFSIICEKLSDLSRAARCEALRVAQDDNFESSHNQAPAPEPPSEPVP